MVVEARATGVRRTAATAGAKGAAAQAADELLQWQWDCVGWAKKFLRVRNPETDQIEPLVFTPEQEDDLREATRRDPDTGRFVHKFSILSWPKRCGKSLCVAVVICWIAACFVDRHIAIIANSERQAESALFKTVLSFFRHSPLLQKYVNVEDVKQGKIVIPSFGNDVRTYADNETTIQGIEFNVLACDELHASITGGASFSWAAAQTENINAIVLVSSQAGDPDEQNPMWRFYQQRDLPYVFFSYRSEPFTAWAVRMAAQERPFSPLDLWNVRWRNAWGISGLKLFRGELVDAAASEAWHLPTTAKQWLELRRDWRWLGRRYTIGVGLDRAGVSIRGDRSVITVVARFEAVSSPPNPLSLHPSGWGEGELGNGEGKVDWGAMLEAAEAEIEEEIAPRTISDDPEYEIGLDFAELMDDAGRAALGDRGAEYRVIWQWVMPTGSEAEVLRACDQIEAIFGRPNLGLFEAYNVDDLLEKVSWAEKCTPTQQMQTGLYTHAWRLFEERRLSFPAKAGVWVGLVRGARQVVGGLLKRELKSFGYRVLNAVTLKWKQQAGHDDCVDSLVLAIRAAGMSARGGGETRSYTAGEAMEQGW